ncbi:MAG: phenylalanine--tRNA ligase subunit beta [Lachnospiraceae bacterium]|nr:phenylalanine--tRNA ligase subunit beta [Lachnospiraceae bacterium]
MLVPLSWLKDYVDIDVTPDVLEKKLFDGGFEVEEKYELGKDISNVVVGLVETCEAIPDTHLHVCRVNAGSHGTFQVCCGADNVEAGGKYPLALVGASVYATAKDHVTIEGVMTIKKGKLRGYESEGMLCAGVEIGLTEDLYPGAGYNGLLVLPQDATPGEDVKALTGLDDWMFDIALTANRPDCQSILGIAREVSAMLEKPLKMPATDYTENGSTKDGFKVTVEASDLCPRYMAHYVSDITMGESPAWMKRRLALVGMNSISNIVDITNYVLKEIGQPMHAFDENFLEGNEIVVRRAKDGEHIVTLDEQEYELTSNNLVICDGVKPVALAGVMGGLNSEIRETTSGVVFECAKFARDNVRKTARALGKNSDASARYEKGVDEYSTVLGLKRALHLIEELGCGKVSSTHCDVNVGNSIEPQEMSVSIQKVNSVLGITVPTEDILRIMTNLNFAPKVDGDKLTIQVPAYREDMLPEGENDVERYPDVAEEVIRLYGYDHVESHFLPEAQVTIGGLNAVQKGEMALKNTLCSMGIYECMHYSFYSPADLDLLKYEEDAPERKAISILNPINVDLSIMRTTLAPSMVNAIARNEKAGTLEGRLFEVAKIFLPKSLPLTEYPEEKQTLCVGIFGNEETFYTMKGIANTIADSLQVSFEYEATTKTFTHPYQTVKVICQGEEIGYFGKLAYDIQNELNMRTSALVMELDLEKLSQWYHVKREFTPLSKFPEEKRDLAVLMDKDITFGQVEEAVCSACKYVKEVKLFDVYEGGQIPEGKKSMAYTVTFAPKEEALDAERVSKFVDKIVGKLSETLKIELRG